jgi:hypothetical protein
MDLESIRNYQELAVCDLITASAARYPALAARPGLLSDVACVALNALKPRYIKHNVDLHFFETPAERARNEAAVRTAVEAAFEFVSHRTNRASLADSRRLHALK